MKQMDSQLKMQAVQPQMKKLREKYKDDKQRLTEEMMKLNKEAGVNPLASCLPVLIQAPVFIGLFHVLRMFQPVNDGPGGPTEWFYRSNVYFFGHEDVVSMGNAQLPGGAPLVGYMTMPQDQLAFMDGVREAIIWWGVPLTILAGIATHLTSRRSVMRQREMNIDASANPQTAIMNKLMLYMFPLFVIVGGPFFPIAILFYWLANNSWTFGQLWVAHKIQDRRALATAKVVEEEKEAARFSTPKPGARPKTSNRPVVQPSKVVDADAGEPTSAGADGGVSGVAGAGASAASATAGDTGGNGQPGGRSNGGPSPGSKPSPGARPQRGPGQQPRKKKRSGRR